MAFKHLCILACSAFLVLPGCRKHSTDPALWYAALSTEIALSIRLEADTTHLEYLADSTFSHRTFIHQGHVFREEWYDSNGQLQGQSLFSPNGKYELRRELCPNGVIAYEGILIKNKFYGPCTWRYCNGRVRQQGIRFAGREIGVWRRWSEDGTLVDSIQRGNNHLTDSLMFTL